MGELYDFAHFDPFLGYFFVFYRWLLLPRWSLLFSIFTVPSYLTRGRLPTLREDLFDCSVSHSKGRLTESFASHSEGRFISTSHSKGRLIECSTSHSEGRLTKCSTSHSEGRLTLAASLLRWNFRMAASLFRGKSYTNDFPLWGKTFVSDPSLRGGFRWAASLFRGKSYADGFPLWGKTYVNHHHPPPRVTLTATHSEWRLTLATPILGETLGELFPFLRGSLTLTTSHPEGRLMLVII